MKLSIDTGSTQLAMKDITYAADFMQTMLTLRATYEPDQTKRAELEHQAGSFREVAKTANRHIPPTPIHAEEETDEPQTGTDAYMRYCAGKQGEDY